MMNIVAAADAWSHADPAIAAALFQEAVSIHARLNEPDEAYARARLAAHFGALALAERATVAGL